MGCDIHLYKEKHVDGKWTAADEWVSYDYGDDDKGVDVPWNKRFTDRNYDLFGLLSKGVRREYPFSFEPRGVPFDACPEYAGDVERIGEDGHSHSYLYLHELKAMQSYLQSATVTMRGMKDRDELEALRASIASDAPDWDLLYPYCAWASSSDYTEFEVDVPASFAMGDGLARIIASFDGIDGDNHRIVFYFDN